MNKREDNLCLKSQLKEKDNNMNNKGYLTAKTDKQSDEYYTPPSSNLSFKVYSSTI